MKLKDFLIFIICLFISVFLLGLGVGFKLCDNRYSTAIIFSGLFINGVTHFFLWKKFWNHLKSLL